jgi:hypothetical protein
MDLYILIIFIFEQGKNVKRIWGLRLTIYFNTYVQKPSINARVSWQVKVVSETSETKIWIKRGKFKKDSS